MRIVFIILLLLHTASGCSQNAALFRPTADTFLLPLGDSQVPVHKSHYGGVAAPFFVHLHHNEQTADSAAQHFLEHNGGMLVSLQNGRQRFVNFFLDTVVYRFDPNRIFTPAGAERSLRMMGPFAPAALNEVLRFGDSLLTFIPDSLPVIAVHNNSNGAYSILSYLAGGDLAGEAAEVFRNPAQDPDDFILTTDAAIFAAMKAAGINAILQNGDKAVNDGSLGYVFRKERNSYVNVEAEHGHLQQQLGMLRVLVHHINNGVVLE